MEARGGLAPAGEDEALERRQLLVEAVAVALERLDLALGDAQALLARAREVGAEVEELVLDADEHVAELGWKLRRERDPELRVRLVDGAEGLHARMRLRDAAEVAERRLPRVAGPRVDPRQPHRLVPLAHGP